ncbi:MAG: hypothetical protein MJE68_18565, partial [Proteobacteria bacterium]|nr:hypothetical protein [Pseudomonadota bacterium]
MRREGRGEECDTTTHLIKIQIFTQSSCVTKCAVMSRSSPSSSSHYMLLCTNDILAMSISL